MASSRFVGCALVAALGHPAAADTFVTAETPAAFAVSDAQAGLFRPGAMPALGAYADGGWYAVGVRVRAGVLADGPAPGGHFMSPGPGGLATGGLAARVFAGPRRAGAWIEAVLGGGITGSEAVPVVEAGAGWDVSVGGVDLGPSVRYARAFAGAGDRLGDAGLVLIGIDVRFGRKRRDRIARVASVAPAIAPPPAPPPPPPPIESDRDVVADALPSCSQEPDACPLDTQLQVIDDRIVLDDRVLFDVDRAHVHAAGRDLIGAVVWLWQEHPDWAAITVEGHADVRGDDDYNQALSERRAAAVRWQMIRAGADGARIDAVGYGRSRPRDPGTDEAAHRRNRRVEFVVHRRSAP
jgi:outer membrane protein OmpA-like peptidoglycan-associated protein